MSNLTCKNGLIIPALETTPRNAIIYLAALLYCFLGIAIAADIFMCSIEKITSATRKVKKTKEKNPLVDTNQVEEEEFEEIKIWNPTVANLTLMALGSSAPEILLSIIEIVGNGFKAGDLGPGTIVGSAAFNLFCISAICVLAVHSPETKRIEMFKVFIVTAFFGTFAYIWLLVVLVFISPNVVEVWEAALTLIFFIILIIMAYSADVEIWKSKKANLHDELEMSMDPKKASPGSLEASIKRYASMASLQDDGSKVLGPLPTPDVETVRTLTRQVSRVYPQLSADEQAKILAYRLTQRSMHDRLYYRIKAIRMFTSSWKKNELQEEIEAAMAETQEDGRAKPVIEFAARVYSIDAHDERITLTIVRRGPCKKPITVHYTTVNGVAKRDLHFLFKSETIPFKAGERTKNISIELVKGAEWRPNHVFYVHLKIQDQQEDDQTKLGTCNVARVRFPDDTNTLMGEPGVEFVKANYVAKEDNGYVRCFITRRGRIHGGDLTVEYETADITAQETSDYVPVKQGKIQFTGKEYEKYIDIEILDDKQDEKDETFSIELLRTDSDEIAIGKKRRTIVTIISDDNLLKNITSVRKLLGHYMRKMTPGQSTWREQIINASSVNAGDIANASMFDCIMHGLAFPWKFIFAFVPPPSLLGGYLCFIVALTLIGFVTAIIGDVASIFGCMVGMKDAVTAITLVALGTSLPDTFASKIAAENDDTADNAVGNVTGSNSVNVFLGLGLPWLLASIYWATKGESFQVQAGDLAFGVTVFTVFSILFLVVLVARRTLSFFGKAELGGPVGPKIASGMFFILLWFGYIGLSIWKSG